MTGKLLDTTVVHLVPSISAKAYEFMQYRKSRPGLFVSGIPIPDTHSRHGSGIGIPEPLTIPDALIAAY